MKLSRTQERGGAHQRPREDTEEEAPKHDQARNHGSSHGVATWVHACTSVRRWWSTRSGKNEIETTRVSPMPNDRFLPVLIRE